MSTTTKEDLIATQAAALKAIQTAPLDELTSTMPEMEQGTAMLNLTIDVLSSLPNSEENQKQLAEVVEVKGMHLEMIKAMETRIKELKK